MLYMHAKCQTQACLQGTAAAFHATQSLLLQVDAFTTQPFRGNSAAVCLLTAAQARHASDATLQAMALENNVSETAFVSPRSDTGSFDDCEFDLRWFTPTTEVNLCGHATLATAAALSQGAAEQCCLCTAS